jgi:hypothetical protein
MAVPHEKRLPESRVTDQDGASDATGTAKPWGDDNGDDGEPGYGTGVDWDEFHTHVKWNQTD